MKQAKFKRFFPAAGLALGMDGLLYEYRLCKSSKGRELYRRLVTPTDENEFLEMYWFSSGAIFVISKVGSERRLVFENWLNPKPLFVRLLDDMFVIAAIERSTKQVDCRNLQLIRPVPEYRVGVHKGTDKPIPKSEIVYEAGILSFGGKHFVPGVASDGAPQLKEITATQAADIRRLEQSSLAASQWERVPIYHHYAL